MIIDSFLGSYSNVVGLLESLDKVLRICQFHDLVVALINNKYDLSNLSPRGYYLLVFESTKPVAVEEIMNLMI